jgi:hypothetical protein
MAHHDVAGHGSADDEYLPRRRAPRMSIPMRTRHHHQVPGLATSRRYSLWSGPDVQWLINRGAQQAVTVQHRWLQVRCPASPAPRLQQFPERDRYEFRRSEEAPSVRTDAEP